MPDEEKERRWAHANGLTTAVLDEFQRFCEWLEQRPNHAAYPLQVPNEFDRLISDDRKIARLRRYVRILFWASGYGWRKRKTWRERLAELRAEMAPPALAAEEPSDG
ncbi:MAG TPA: hypothetical protein VGE07_24965 [Herpetosiphonaceae bacterium]